MAERFRAERAERTAAFELALPARRAFELFTPEGEKAWAAGWDPEYLHPADGRLEAGMVFRTHVGGEETLWIVANLDADAATVEYVRVTPGSRLATVRVHCEPVGDARCRVTVRYGFTGLTESGNAWVCSMDERRYGAFVDSWRAAIEARLGPARDPADQ